MPDLMTGTQDPIAGVRIETSLRHWSGLRIAVAVVHAPGRPRRLGMADRRGDAQRTFWIRTDPKISVESMSKPGFELQWTREARQPARGAERTGARA